MTDRSYVNNLITEDGKKVHEVWGANYQRLVTVKRRYDPDNVFRLNHNIDPLAGGASAPRPTRQFGSQRPAGPRRTGVRRGLLANQQTPRGSCTAMPLICVFVV